MCTIIFVTLKPTFSKFDFTRRRWWNGLEGKEWGKAGDMIGGSLRPALLYKEAISRKIFILSFEFLPIKPFNHVRTRQRR